MSFDATFEVVGNIEAKLNPVQNIDAKFGEMYESGGVDVEPLSVTENGTYTAPTGKAYSPVSVNVAGIDVSDTTAVAGDVRNGKKFHLANGSLATGSYAWDFRADSVEFVEVVTTQNQTLDNTDYASWTPSTTTKTLESATTKTATVDLSNYEYWVLTEFESDMVYSSDATGARTVRRVSEHWFNVSRRANDYSQLVAGTGFTANNVIALPTQMVFSYYATTNVLLINHSATAGVYANSPNAPTVNGTTLSISSPAIYAKCNATYFSTTNASKVIQSTSGYKYKTTLYRTPIGGMARQMYGKLVTKYNNP